MSQRSKNACAATFWSKPMGRWTTLIDEMVEGRWINPETGKPGTVPYEKVVIDRSSRRARGGSGDLARLQGAGRGVCDENTHGVMGARVAKALQAAHNSGISSVDTIVLDHPHADEEKPRAPAREDPERRFPGRGRLRHDQRPLQIRDRDRWAGLLRVRHRAFDERLYLHHGRRSPSPMGSRCRGRLMRRRVSISTSA